MNRVINTDYPDIIRFIFSDLRVEQTFPNRDNFLLFKALTYKESQRLMTYRNYVVVSKNFIDEFWGRTEIFEYVKAQNNSRRKPDLESLSKDDFEKAMKLFILNGSWLPEVETKGLFNLYANILDRTRATEIAFTLLGTGMSPVSLYHAVLTFVGKAIDLKAQAGLSAGYHKVLHAASKKVTKTLNPALTQWVETEGTDDNVRIIRFIQDIGGYNDRR